VAVGLVAAEEHAVEGDVTHPQLQREERWVVGRSRKEVRQEELRDLRVRRGTRGKREKFSRGRSRKGVVTAVSPRHSPVMPSRRTTLCRQSKAPVYFAEPAAPTAGGRVKDGGSGGGGRVVAGTCNAGVLTLKLALDHLAGAITVGGEQRAENRGAESREQRSIEQRTKE
jgi:hypothetical protein